MSARLFLIAALLSSAACSSADEMERDVGVERQAGAGRVPQPPQPADPATGVAFSDNTADGVGERTFSYAWPAEVGAIPPLAAMLERERDRSLAEQREEYAEALADSPEDCVSCRGRTLEVEWKVVADLPRWLSLSADIYTYTGGAHGNSGTVGLVWDREAGARLKPLDLFRSPTALGGAISQRYCARLDEERARRRGAPVDAADEVFGTCPEIGELTVLLGSSNGQSFNRIGLIADPYVAGSYAEGAYEVTLPVDTAIIDAVKPEYAGSFSLGARK